MILNAWLYYDFRLFKLHSSVSVIVALLLFSYHRCKKMISEALELRVEGGRVNHSLCV